MQEINPTDWARIFLGSAPPAFYLELIIRAFFIYALLMSSMRILGKRMNSQISRVEMAAMTAFASAVGVPMLSPMNGLLPPVIIAIIIISITKITAKISFKSQNFERVTQGDIDCLVVDSVMKPEVMKKVRISRERLFSKLRSECVVHLGMVERVYLEANGTFTIISSKERQAGLSVLPSFDKDFIEEMVETTNVEICGNCGEQKPQKTTDDTVACSNCGAGAWTQAVINV